MYHFLEGGRIILIIMIFGNISNCLKGDLFPPKIKFILLCFQAKPTSLFPKH